MQVYTARKKLGHVVPMIPVRRKQQWVVMPVAGAAEEARITEMTAIRCSWHHTPVDSLLLLGGNGVVVQMNSQWKIITEIHT